MKAKKPAPKPKTPGIRPGESITHYYQRTAINGPENPANKPGQKPKKPGRR